MVELLGRTLLRKLTVFACLRMSLGSSYEIAKVEYLRRFVWGRWWMMRRRWLEKQHSKVSLSKARPECADFKIPRKTHFDCWSISSLHRNLTCFKSSTIMSLAKASKSWNLQGQGRQGTYRLMDSCWETAYSPVAECSGSVDHGIAHALHVGLWTGCSHAIRLRKYRGRQFPPSFLSVSVGVGFDTSRPICFIYSSQPATPWSANSQLQFGSRKRWGSEVFHGREPIWSTWGLDNICKSLESLISRSWYRRQLKLYQR